MNRMHWFKNSLLVGIAVFGLALSGSGCQQDVVHNRAMAELNQKAQSMMAAGDYEGAVARLEAAHDLQPDEPNTTYNLAIAYQMKGDYEKAIPMFEQVMDKPGMNRPEILKALGITHEAMADKLSAQVAELEDDPKSDKANVPSLKQHADEQYVKAIEYYRQALPGVKNPEEVQKQIEALEEHRRKAAESTSPGN